MRKLSNENFKNKVPVEIIIDSIVEQISALKQPVPPKDNYEDERGYIDNLNLRIGYNGAIDDVIRLLKPDEVLTMCAECQEPTWFYKDGVTCKNGHQKR